MFLIQYNLYGLPEWPKCPVDLQEHFLVNCPKFRDDREFTVEQRLQLVEKLKRCMRCFSPTHGSSANPSPCTWKRGKPTCELCLGVDHHTLLHRSEATLLAECFDTVLVDQEYKDKLVSRHTAKCTLRQTVVCVCNLETGASIKINALLDTCCAHTQCHIGLAHIC